MMAVVNDDDKLEVFIQKHIGHSMGKLCRNHQYWHSFSDKLEILIQEVRRSLSIHMIAQILNKPYLLKKNKRKAVIKAKTISFFHFLTKDMCNYWPRLHDKHFSSTWNIIKIVLENGSMPLLQYNKESKAIYSYECILLLLNVFGRHYPDDVHKISETMQYILSLIKNHHSHPSLVTFFVDKNTMNQRWLYLDCSIQDKSQELKLNVLSPPIIVLFLQRNHNLFELRDSETNELINDDMQYLSDINMNLIKSFDSSLIISLCFISFILPQIHQKLFEIIYTSFMSSKHEILISISMDVVSLIMDYTLITHYKYKSKQTLLPLIPPNIKESDLIEYVLKECIKLNNKEWCKWVSNTVFRVLNISQIEQFRHYTSDKDKAFNDYYVWNDFFVENCKSSFVFKWILVFGGTLNTRTMRCLIRSNYNNLSNLQTIFSLDSYSFDTIWNDPQTLMKIFSDRDLDKSTLLFICTHICEHLTSFGKFKNGFDVIQSVFRSDSYFNKEVLDNLSIILSNPLCIKLKLNASVNFDYLYNNHHNELLYLIEHDLLDFVYCVKHGDLTSEMEEYMEQLSFVWMWIKQKYKECNNDETKNIIQNKLLDVKVDKDLIRSLLD